MLHSEFNLWAFLLDPLGVSENESSRVAFLYIDEINKQDENGIVASDRKYIYFGSFTPAMQK
jgi:hypothetical protein